MVVGLIMIFVGIFFGLLAIAAFAILVKVPPPGPWLSVGAVLRCLCSGSLCKFFSSLIFECLMFNFSSHFLIPLLISTVKHFELKHQCTKKKYLFENIFMLIYSALDFDCINTGTLQVLLSLQFSFS